MASTTDILALIDTYAESRHLNGAPEYNSITRAARDAVVFRLQQGDAEMQEQCRLLGMSAERELALRAELERTKFLFAVSCNHEAITQMRADAERYRWLRDEDAGVPDGMRELCVVQFRLPFSDEPDTELFGRYLDAAIDAARQSSAGGEGQA